jgi:hypothetical protein
MWRGSPICRPDYLSSSIRGCRAGAAPDRPRCGGSPSRAGNSRRNGSASRYAAEFAISTIRAEPMTPTTQGYTDSRGLGRPTATLLSLPPRCLLHVGTRRWAMACAGRAASRAAHARWMTCTTRVLARCPAENSSTGSARTHGQPGWPDDAAFITSSRYELALASGLGSSRLAGLAIRNVGRDRALCAGPGGEVLLTRRSVTRSVRPGAGAGRRHGQRGSALRRVGDQRRAGARGEGGRRPVVGA